MFENGELAQALGVEQPEQAPAAQEPAGAQRPLGIDNRLS
jgi:hypothetical protein